MRRFWVLGLLITLALVAAAGAAMGCSDGSGSAGLTYCNEQCLWSYVGNGKCDISLGCSVAQCNYDGGDCDWSYECEPGCVIGDIGDGQCQIDCYNAFCDWDNGDCADVEFCSTECPYSWVGDGECDTACNNSACNWDKGDCAASGSTYCATGCPYGWIGDGECDSACNNYACNYDGGDCSYSSYCAPGCPYSWISDGECDAACNNAACNWDGVDCPESCATGCPYEWIGDGICDDSCYNYACSWDGGDCDITECEAGYSLAFNDNTMCCQNGYPYYWASDGMCHTTAPYSVPTPTQYAEISRYYEWEYDGAEWTWTLTIPEYLYDYYSSLDRPPCHYGDCDYSILVKDSWDDAYIESLVTALRSAAQEEGYSEWDTINFAVAFVQSLPYTSDIVTTGYDQYARYPVETLIDNGGDCEDTSILMAAIIDELGYGVVMLYIGDYHYAVGVLGGEGITGTYWNYNGGKYFYLETTGSNWEIGKLPPEFEGLSAYVYDVN